MKKTLVLLIASTALTTVIGVAAWSAVRAPGDTITQIAAAVFDDAQESLPLVFVSSDDDDDEREHRSGARYDDDDEDDCDEDDDDDDDENCIGNARNPAPAGTVAPPQNGLFGNGAPPQVQVN
ncbi:hypothetical protein [Oceaniovalibus sp. ACAM 378]|uniref:hypothetical protein n=1 Tax=Oceaniovalibus sp. ACAM 378 TaxID=2599923 RepID=UPI0011D6474E|nr:hypothetical protein [Oceaniovalibus sp. ACAM 378]TYB86132.1 hypothetical protein FQ320_17840 [Oceaniovalibus sp. ACAM 378]